MSVFHKIWHSIRAYFSKNRHPFLRKNRPSPPSPPSLSNDTDLRKASPSPQIKIDQQKTTSVLFPPTSVLPPFPQKGSLLKQNTPAPSKAVILEANGKCAVLLLVGMFLFSIGGYWFQKEAEEPKAEENALRLHQVKQGDTLWNLSCFYYGSPHFWKEIFLANQEELRTSGRLLPGMILWIPENQEKIPPLPILPEH
ncbi:MAG: LysM peptidoglycan-binding domain-containing protein [Planctomycetota bacterium]